MRYNQFMEEEFMPKTLAKTGVYVLLATGFEETDVSTMARSLRRSGWPVTAVGLAAGPVRGAYGLSLAADRLLSEIETECPLAVVLPGGAPAAGQLSADPRVHLLLQRVVREGGYVAGLGNAYSVLTSAALLPLDPPQPGAVSGAAPAAGPPCPGPDVLSPWRAARVEVYGQVIYGRATGAVQDVADTLASLLEQRV